MTLSRKAGLMALAMFALTFGGAATARADVITFTSFGAFQSAANAAGVAQRENVLAQGTATGMLVTGITNQSNLLVNVSSSTALTISEANGQARFAGAGGATFDDFTIRLQSGAPFQALAFNLNETSTCTQQNPCMLEFTLTGSVNASEVTQTITYTGGSGFIGFLALGNQSITSVTLTGGDITLDNISQVRIGGIAAAVPEPLTMLLFGTGLAGVAAKMRRRRKA